MEINTAELKEFAPLIPYIETHYKDKIRIENRTKETVFCRCLWHSENTPSLAFFSNGTYKCFGCGEHGDIITLVQKLENVGFEGACKIIGDNVGYEVILQPPNPAHEAYKSEMDEHVKRYWNNLQGNAEVLSYIMNGRGISPDMIDLFRIGFTDSEEYKYRTVGGISSKITFPILEHKRKNAKCVGVGYRGLTDEKPKYTNDPNLDGREGQNPELSGVFIKSHMLYGMHQAYEGIKKFGHIIVAEGYFDVISLHQSGFTNAVGSMGTTLSETQIKEISKLTNNVMLMYDSDSAGISAMCKYIGDFFKEGINVVVCLFENGKDPADVCKSLGFDYFKVNNIIKESTMQGIEFVIDRTVRNYENAAMRERTKAVKTLEPIIDSMPNGMLKDIYRNQVLKRLDSL